MNARSARPSRPARVASSRSAAASPASVAAVVRRQVVLEEHDVAPDGSVAVVVHRHVAGNAYGSHLWLVPLDGRGRPRRLTDGAVRDTHPRFRADGRAIAFRRVRRDDEPHVRRLMVLELDGRGRTDGEAWAVTTGDVYVS